MIPLIEMLAEIYGVRPESKKVCAAYEDLIESVGPELFILQKADLSDIRKKSSLLAEALWRMRERKVIIQPGYDGLYGTIRVFSQDELARSM